MGELPNSVKKRYNDDNIFNYIKKNLISLRDQDIKKNNEHLRTIIQQGLIPLMKKDEMFNDFYRNITYAGSYYKGTKVGKPDEYDLDLTISLPLNYKHLKVETNHSKYGYVKIKVKESSKLPKWETHSKELNKWLDTNGYLDRTKFSRWIERVLRKSYDHLNKVEKYYELNVNDKTYILQETKKSGPAYTIFVKSKEDLNDSNVMSVDLAPCLEFVDVPLNDYKTIPKMSQKFLVVSKDSNEVDNNILWRLSFYEQERQLLLKNEFGKIKPIIRMIKKFRDTMNWKKLASYYIETLCLNELTKNEDSNFLRKSQTHLFMHMMDKLREAFEQKNLPYFWHEKYNLIGHIDEMEIYNRGTQLKKLIATVEKNISTEKFVIAEFILQKEAAEIKDLVCLTIKDKQSESVLSKASSTFTVNSEDSVDSSLQPYPEPHPDSEKRSDNENVKNIENRISGVCQELFELSKLRGDLTNKHLKLIRDACVEFMMPLNAD